MTSRSDSIKGNFFNGKNSLCQPCVLRIDSQGDIEIDGITGQTYHFADINISPRISAASRTLYFPDGAFFESRDNDTIDNAIKRFGGEQKRGDILHRAESKLRYAALAATLILLVAAAALIYGLPAISKQLAYALPDEVSTQLATESLRKLDKLYFKPSQLSAKRRQALTDMFKRHAPADDLLNYRIYFRKGGIIGPNAFALPDGRVIITDELVQLSDNDIELLAVLYHEIGHVRHRHSLRQVIQGTGALAIFAWLTGDIEAMMDWSSALPAYLVQRHYSRNLEAEADAFALQQMLANNQDPIHFVNLMEKLQRYAACNKIDNSDTANGKNIPKPDSEHCKAGNRETAQAEASDTPADSDKEKSRYGTITTAVLYILASHPPTAERQEVFRKASQDFWGETSY